MVSTRQVALLPVLVEGQAHCEHDSEPRIAKTEMLRLERAVLWNQWGAHFKYRFPHIPLPLAKQGLFGTIIRALMDRPSLARNHKSIRNLGLPVSLLHQPFTRCGYCLRVANMAAAP